MKKFILFIGTVLFVLSFNFATAQYCTPVYTLGCQLGDGLTQFKINTLVQAIPCSGIPNYYHDYTSLSTDLAKNGYYLLSVQSSSAGLKVSVWIDYDQSTTFNNAEELVQQFTCTSATTYYYFPITIPNTATTGSTRLRILSSMAGFPSNPCSDPGAGNGCDFNVNIIAPVTPATVITQGATGVTSVTAVLNGSINAQNNATQVEFHYGLTSAYGSTIAGVPGTITGNSTIPVAASVSGLLPNTTYHYEVIGHGAGGYISGGDVTFTTNTMPLPIVVTNNATNITGVSATFNGTVNASSSPASVSFEYGTSIAYGRSIAGNPATVNTSSADPVTADVTGLDLNTLYHYRIVSTNAAGTSYGVDKTFTTLPHQYCTPVFSTGCSGGNNMGITYFGLNTIAQTIPCTGTPSYYHDYTSTSTDLALGVTYNITVSVASISFSINCKVWIDYNHNNVFDAATETAGSGYCGAASTATFPITVSASAITGTTGLRIFAKYNGYPGDPCSTTETYGNCADFSVNILSSATAATVTTVAATGIAGSGATLNGTVNPNGFSASNFFDYGTTVSYGTTVNGSPYIVSGSSPNSVSAVINGLLPNTIYHYRSRASNAGGPTNGADLTFTSSPVLPVATTTSATGIGGTSATLNGTVNPNNASSSISFEYGLTTSYGTTVVGSPASVTGYTVQSGSAGITGLALNSTYHYRIISTNVAGTVYGNDMTFTTLPTVYCIPVFSYGCSGSNNMGITYFGLNTIAQTIPCTGTPSYYHDYTATSTDLALGVTYNITVSVASISFGINCKVWIDYNHNNVFDAATETAGSGYCGAASTATFPITVSASALTGTTGLRVFAKYNGYPGDPCSTSETYGNCADFSVNILSSATPAIVTTVAATGIAGSGATLNGTVNPNGFSASNFFDYGTAVSYGTTVNGNPYIVTGSSPTGVSATISGLLPNTIYHYRARGMNAGGITNGTDLIFTSSPIPPVVITTAATSLGGTSAILNGTVNPNNAASSVSFEYGLTTSYGNTVTGSPASVTGYSVQSSSAQITGLEMNTTYHYRIVSTNVAGTTYGNDMTLTTTTNFYCIPEYSYGCSGGNNMGITYFELNTIAQTIPCTGTPSYYHDYTAIPSTNLALSGTYPVKVSVGSVSFGIYSKVWIDYNHNNVFDAATETAGSGYCGAATTATFSITINGAALTGATTLRVMTRYNGYATDPCSTTETYGNCADFSVFIVPAAPPTVSTSVASFVKTATATLNGIVNPGGYTTTVTFDYGLTAAYGSTKTGTPSPLTGGIVNSVSGAITGLLSNTTYHYRIKGVSSQGTSYGSDMTFTTLSSTTTQANTLPMNLGALNEQIIGIEILNLNPSNPVEATSFTFNTNGTTQVSDLAKARLYFTGTSGTFATSTQFGAEVASFGTLGSPFTITGTQALATGTNHFWLTYDVSPGATPLNVTDAECTSVTVGNAMIPAVTAPAGNRQIIDDKFLQSVTITQASVASVIKGSSDNEILKLDFSVTGSTGTLPLNEIVVTNSGYDSDISAGGVKLYRTSTPVFATTNPLGTAQSFSSLSAIFTSLAYELPTGHTYIWVCYDIASAATGFHLADAKILPNSINVNGTLYPATEQNPSGGRLITVVPKTLPLTESAWATVPPADWNKTGVIWSFSNTNIAGGVPAELHANYSGALNGDKMISPPLNTAGLPYLILRFKHYLSNFGAGCTLRIQSSSDGINWTNEAWSLQPMTGGIFGPGNVETTITSNLSGGVTYVAFVLTGNPTQINDWYIDNVKISAPEPPAVTTASASAVTGNSATSGGDVTDDATNPVTVRGVCWSTLANPTTADSHTTNGAGLGAFVSSIAGLSEGTTYHVRAYATNGIATGYGNDLTFTTLGANVFNVTGGGTYCTGGTGLSVGLDGSQVTATYQLYKNAVAFGAPIPGTGGALSWSNMTDGTYTVEATTGFGTVIMTGNAVVSSYSNPVSVSIVATTSTPCPGIPVTFTATPLNGGTTPVFQWKVNDIDAGSNSFQYSYLPANGDVVKCILTSNIACPSGNPATSNPVNILISVPVPNLYGSATECAGASGINYSTDAGGGITNYIWNVSSGGTITAGGTTSSSTVTVTWNTAGPQTVSVNYKNSYGCTAVSPTVKNVTVNLSPAPGITGPASFCGTPSPGAVYTTEAGFASYVWTVSSGGTITAGQGTSSITVTWTTTGSKTVTVNYANSFGCSAVTPAVKNVTIYALPVPAITGNATICAIPSTGNVYTTEAGMTGYSWSISAGGTVTAGGTATDNSVTVTWTTLGANTVSVTYTNTNGCNPVSPTIKNIGVALPPVPTVTGPVDICGLPSAGNIYHTEAGMSNYSWTVSSGGTITSGQGTKDLTVTWTTTGAKTVTVSYAQSGCFPLTPTVYPVNVNSFITPTITGPALICEIPSPGNVYTTEPGMSGYTWTVSTGGTITAGLGTNSIVVSWTTTGAKTVTISYTNGAGCSPISPTVKNVNVYAVPVPSITGNSLICGIPSAGNVYTTQTGMSGYAWTVSPGGTITSGGSATDRTVTVNWTTTGPQTVAVAYSAAAGCPATAPVTYPVAVFDFTPSVITGPSGKCGVPSAGNVYTTDPGYLNYVWTASPGGTITAGAGTNAITVTWTTSGTKTVTVTYNDANGCHPASPIVKNVDMYALPVPVITGNTPICDPPSAGNVYSTAAGMTNYAWSISAGGTITSGGSANDNSITVDWTAVGTQTVSVGYTDTHGCTSASPSVKNVIVSTSAPVSVTIAASANPSCSGSSVTFNATPLNGGASPAYQWKVNGSNAGSNNGIYTYYPVNGDVVTCVMTSNYPCPTGSPATSNAITMLINPRPAVPVSGGNQTVCSTTLPATLSATPPVGSTVDWYQYSSGGGVLASGSNTYNASTTGNYYAESRDLTTGCKSATRTLINLLITTSIKYYLDADGDGYGNPEVYQNACIQPASYVTNALDCDDNDPSINPASQYIAYTGNVNFVNSIVSPTTGSPSTLFHFEADYFSATNSLPSAGYPRLMLDYEGNGSYLDANDRIVIMTAFDPTDVTTTNGKRYFAEVNNLPYGSGWKSKIMVGSGGICSTVFGPFNYPDVLHEPNLYIFANDISFSPVHPGTSSALTIHAIVHNESDYAASNFVCHLINQWDPSIVYPDVLVANLPAHQNTTVTWNIVTPAVPAWCPMQVTVDYTDVIGENNELDNSAVRPFTNGNYQVAGRIVVTTDVSPHSSFTNQYNYLYVYGHALYEDLAVPLLDPSVAGATVTVINTETHDTVYGYTNSWGDYGFYIPAPDPPGTYHVKTEVTDFTLTGSDTTHFHINASPPPPPPQPNLTLNYCHSVDVQPVNPHLAGGTVTLVAHVVNNGNATAPGPIQVNFTYAGSPPVMGFAPAPAGLAPGQSVNVSVVTALPVSGTQLTAYADPNNLVMNESNETVADNSSTDNMCYEFQPTGLCGGNFWGTHCYTPGLTIGLNVGLNISRLYDANPVKVKFEVSGPGIVGWETVGTGQLNNATRNCYCPYAVSCPNPYMFAQIGTYTFRMTADPDNEYPECNEGNNVLTVTVNVVNCAPPTKPNLTLSYCHAVDVTPVNPHLGADVNLVARVTNNGNATAIGTVANPIEVTFTYAGGGSWTEQFVGTLAAGQSMYFTKVNAPLPVSGTLMTAYVDPNNWVDEWNETDADNSSTDNMCYDFQPVPHCGTNFWSRTYLVGQSASLSVGVNVRHLYDANPVKVKFEVSGPGIIGIEDIGNAILSNATRNCSCPWVPVLPAPFTFFNAGTYHFKMTVDPDNEYPECDETNNVLEVDVIVLGGADMRVLSQFINPTPLNPAVNEPASMIVSYQNIGNSNVNDQMKLRVKVDEVLLSNVFPVPGLATGDHNSIAIPDLWSSSIPGAHVIRAIIDADNQVGETNESNNEATRAIIVGEAANLYFQLFTVSDQHPTTQQYIHINARIGNNGDVNATANIKFYYLNDAGDTIPIGQTPVSVFKHDSVPLIMPWVVADDQTTIIGKIMDVNTLEFNPDDNTATALVGGFDVSVASTPVCQGGTNGTLTASVAGGTAPFLCLWSNGYIGQTLSAGAGSYNLTVTDNTGLSKTSSGTITNYPIPVPTISGDSSACAVSTGHVYVTEAGMSDYIWTVSSGGSIASGGGSADNTVTITWHTAGAQTVSVDYLSANGCSSQGPATYPVTVHPSLPVSVSVVATANPVCSGTSVTFTATPTNGGTLPVYQWKVNGSPVGTTNNSYTYVPDNNDVVSVVLTSNVLCATGNPATYAMDAMIVYAPFVVGSVMGDSAICYNTVSGTLTGIGPTGGNIPYSWQWQRSSNNEFFANIPGATSQNYSPGALTVTTHYRQVQTSASGCGSLTTNTVTVAVYPEFVVGSIAADQVICYNTIPAPLTGTDPTGGNTPYSYQWTSSPDNSTFTDIIGATDLNYSPGALTATTYFRQIQTSASSCGSLTTNVVTVTVYPEFMVGSIESDQTICFNTVPAPLFGILPSGGNTPYTYQWTSSPDNSSFTNIIGATDLNYSPGALTATTYFRQIQTSASGCGTLTTNVVTVTVYPAFMVGSIESDQVICFNAVPAPLFGILPSGGNTPYTYQWASSLDNSSFTNIIGATDLNYSPGALTTTTYFRQVQTSASGCGTLTTNVVTVTVYPEFIVGSIAADQVICYNTIPAPLTGTDPIGGNTPYNYQWTSSRDNSTFTNIIGATDLNYSPGALTATTYFRQVQTSASGCGSLTTNVVTVTVYPEFMVGSIESDQTICFNTVPAPLFGILPSGGNTPYAYQWTSSPDNSSFTNIIGATDLNYSPGALTATTYFRQIQTSASGCGTQTTNVVTVTVYPEFMVGSIAANQVICYIAVPAPLTGTAPTGGNTPYTYQWESSSDNVTFTSIPRATALNYSPETLTATTYFRQIQTSASGCGSLTTNVVTVTVYPEFIVGSIAADQVICYNTIPAPLTGTPPTGGNAPYYYQWASSPDNSNFTNIIGATDLNYSPGALTATTYYRQVQTSTSGCGALTTNVITVTVHPNLVPGFIGTDQLICKNGIPAQLTGTPPTGGTAPYTYQWQNSTDNNVFANIAGATSLNYQPGALGVTTYFKLIQSLAGNCSTATNVVTIEVTPLPLAVKTVTDSTILSGHAACFDATQTVIVTGFLVKAGASVNLIAGQNIRMLNGTKVEPGGYLHGFISDNCLWCSAYPTILSAPLQPQVPVDATMISPSMDKSANNLFRVYPNPTTGAFTLELSEITETSVVKVEIYGMRGERLWTEQYTGEKKHEFTLGGKPKGVYFIRIFCGENLGSQKIIKQ